MSQATRRAIDWVEQGLVPDAVVRAGIRRLCEQRLREIEAGRCERASSATEAFVAAMDAAELAPLPHLANEQHYEVPARFFGLALGPHLKYSCAWWPEGNTTLEAAEARALAATCEHAGLADGQDILEHGCGLLPEPLSDPHKPHQPRSEYEHGGGCGEVVKKDLRSIIL